MRPLLKSEQLDETLSALSTANKLYASRHPGITADRQPVQTFCGSAHHFTIETTRKIGQTALQHLQSYSPDFIEYAHAFRLPRSGSLATGGEVKAALLKAAERSTESLKGGYTGAWLAATVFKRVINKLRRQPVEDFRIDFDDGFGVRDDPEEDDEAVRTAEEVANGMQEGVLPPFIGIRIKPFSDEQIDRSVRTLDLFLGTLSRATGGELPDNFVVGLSKVTIPGQVEALARVLGLLETSAGLPEGSLRIEIMIETPGAIVGDSGRSHLPRLVQAAGGRCQSVHFGVYNYTAGLGISAPAQRMAHPACDFARHMMQTSLAGTGIWMSDGATNILPFAPHDVQSGPLTQQQMTENRDAVFRAWRSHYEDTVRALDSGFYQGWDVHPAQLPARYTGAYSFYLSSLDRSAQRLRSLIDQAGRANTSGDVFDNAATAQALLNFFARAVSCGAITMDEAAESGLSMDELKSRSFAEIIKGRAEPVEDH